MASQRRRAQGLAVAQAAVALGLPVQAGTRMAWERTLPTVQVDGSMRVRRVDLEAFAGALLAAGVTPERVHDDGMAPAYLAGEIDEEDVMGTTTTVKRGAPPDIFNGYDPKVNPYLKLVPAASVLPKPAALVALEADLAELRVELAGIPDQLERLQLRGDLRGARQLRDRSRELPALMDELVATELQLRIEWLQATRVARRSAGTELVEKRQEVWEALQWARHELDLVDIALGVHESRAAVEDGGVGRATLELHRLQQAVAREALQDQPFAGVVA